MATTVPNGIALAPPEPAVSAAPVERHLHGKFVDFLLLGGLSFLLLPIMLALPIDTSRGKVAFATLLLGNVINNPHFAHSYQIFYRGFFAKLGSAELPRIMRIRYLVAGILVPILLVAFFVTAVASHNVRAVGLGGNIMALFVGWHYVKQGYGMLMVDAALKRRFFGDQEKRILLLNAYAVWVGSWLYLNHAAATNNLWGLRYYTFMVPQSLVIAAAFVVAGTSLATAAMLFEKRSSGKKIPTNGLMAYGVTLYLWILFVRINPLWLLVVPALHSLQYLAVVYRFQGNRARARSATQVTSGAWRSAFVGYRVQLAIFAMVGVALGAALFWLIPSWLDGTVPYDHKLYGTTLFLFAFWVFVNVHHYFIDSVMWRRDNPETRLHLFN